LINLRTNVRNPIDSKIAARPWARGLFFCDCLFRARASFVTQQEACGGGGILNDNATLKSLIALLHPCDAALWMPAWLRYGLRIAG
jgi:hypothetical protein